MFKILITRTIGWGGRIDPPETYYYSESFSDRETAEKYAAFLTRHDRFGGITCKVVDLTPVVISGASSPVLRR